MGRIAMAALMISLAASALAADKPARVNAKDFPNLQAAVDALPEGGGEVFLPLLHENTIRTPRHHEVGVRVSVRLTRCLV